VPIRAAMMPALMRTTSLPASIEGKVHGTLPRLVVVHGGPGLTVPDERPRLGGRAVAARTLAPDHPPVPRPRPRLAPRAAPASPATRRALGWWRISAAATASSSMACAAIAPSSATDR